MSFMCRYGCGTWCHIDPSVKTKSGKLIPLTETNEPHNCHLSPYFRKISVDAKARAISKQEIAKIEAWEKKQEQEKELSQ